MKVTKIKTSEVVVNKSGVIAQKVYDHTEALTIHLTLEPGARFDTHTTPVDVFFYILEGTAKIEIADEQELVQKDHIIESPKGIPHAVENHSQSEKLRVLVVKTPKP